MSLPSAPVIVAESSNHGVASQSLRWGDDAEARLEFVLREQTAYVIGITRGAKISGTRILEAFREVVESRRVKVIAVDFSTIGFWEKMVERGLVHDWSMEQPEMLL